MIENLMSKSRTTEVDAAVSRTIGAYQKTSLSSDTHLAGIFTRLQESSSLLSGAINRMKAESDLEIADEKRDQDARALFYLVRGYTYHPNETIKAAAGQVYQVLQHYGIAITGESYSTESSLIGSMLGDLSQTKLKDAIDTLSGCGELIAALQTSNAKFEAARIAFEEEKAQEGTQESASALKNMVVALVNKQLVVYLLAMMQVNEATYGSFGRTIAEIIADNNEVVKKRSAKPEKTTQPEPSAN